MQQGKGFIKFFLIAMTLVCLAQLMFTLPTRKVERNAEAYAERMAATATEANRNAAFKAARAEYLDSMSSETVFRIPLLKNYTYQELKSQQLALGLDLKGGMSVVLQVDLEDFLIALANNSTESNFRDAVATAKEAQKSAQADFITLFADAYRAKAGEGKMAQLFSKNEGLREDINFQTADGEVTRVIRQKADETVDLTFQLLKKRIDKLGVTQPNVSLDAARDLIVVELPGIDNPERAREFLQAAAKLEFWDMYRISDAEMSNAFVAANDRLRQLMPDAGAAATPMRYDTTFATDSLGNVDKSQIVKIDSIPDNFNLAAGPLFDVFAINSTGINGLAVMGTADKNKIKTIDTLLGKPEVKQLFPADARLVWSRDPIKDPTTNELTNAYELYAVKLPRGKTTAPLSGDHVTNAAPVPDPNTGAPSVSLQMDNAGAKVWAQMTTAAANDNNREVGIMLDNEIVSAPRVINPITTGSTSITGSFTTQEAGDLSSILEVGKLPAETRILSESQVGPTLGQENINRSLKSLLLGFGLVVMFMIAYYAGGGLISIIALLLNILFIFGALASLGTVLTLPGIAGIVLTIGMAVDANVIIFERIREELRAGKTIMAAVGDGFKHSYSAIIDANVTTLLTAIVLMWFGLGPIKGFAVVLFVGVLSSLFTAVLVGRLLIEGWLGKPERTIGFWTGWSKNMLSNVNVNWMGMRKYGYMFSGALLVLSLASFFIRGFDLGVDFKGGYSYNVQFEQGTQVNSQTLRDALTPVFGNATPVVKEVADAENTYNITTSYLIDDTDENAPERVATALFDGVNKITGGQLNKGQFMATDGTGAHIISSSQVGATIADDIKGSSFYSATFALLLIFFYLAIRFSNWKFSAGAVAALFHDVIITLGMFSLFHGLLPFSMEIDQAFIAALLTVIGYSVNDTVIVFDRIREFINSYTGKSKEEVFNLAINNTLSRTLITSGTTLIVVLALFLFGGGSIKGFAFALLVGILFGTYSSVFIASAVVVDLIDEIKGKKSEVKEKGTFTRRSTAGSTTTKS